MRGALLASDDEMLPDSQRGFAPVVRGIAKSNAEVSIEQNGYVIYRTLFSRVHLRLTISTQPPAAAT